MEVEKVCTQNGRAGAPSAGPRPPSWHRAWHIRGWGPTIAPWGRTSEVSPSVPPSQSPALTPCGCHHHTQSPRHSRGPRSSGPLAVLGDALGAPGKRSWCHSNETSVRAARAPAPWGGNAGHPAANGGGDKVRGSRCPGQQAAAPGGSGAPEDRTAGHLWLPCTARATRRPGTTCGPLARCGGGVPLAQGQPSICRPLGATDPRAAAALQGGRRGPEGQSTTLLCTQVGGEEISGGDAKATAGLSSKRTMDVC